MRSIVYMMSLAFIFMIPWEGVIELPGLGTGAKIIGLTMAALWVATVVVTGRFRKPGLFQILVGLFVLWNALSVFWSANPDTTFGHLVTWVQLLGMVLILWDLYTTREAVLVGLQVFVLGEFVAIGLAGANFFSGDAYYTHYQRFSPAAQSNPDGFGLMVVFGVPVAWYLASAKSDTKVIQYLRLVNYAYIPAAFLGLVLSGTRTALIASIVGVAFGLASLTRLRLWTRIAIFLLLALAILVLLPQVQDLRSFQRFSTTVPELTEGDLNNRTTHWTEGLTAFVDHPILGIGANMYRSVTSRGNLAHNSFISVLVELGVIGFALFGIILTITIIQAWNQPKWEARFWLSLLLTWAIAASSLTYEHRRATWLFLSLTIGSAGMTGLREETVALGRRIKPDVPITAFTRKSNLPYVVVGILVVVTVISLLTLPASNSSPSGPSALAGTTLETSTPQPTATATLVVEETLPPTVVQTQPVAVIQSEGNCTYGMAHWLKYQDLWGVDGIQVNNVNISLEAALSLISQDPTDVSTLLRQQLVVYFVNINQGADPTAVVGTVLEIEAWLDARAQNVELTETDRLRGLALAKVLRDFNEGVSGPGICPDYTNTPTPTMTLTPTLTPTRTPTVTRTPTISPTVWFVTRTPTRVPPSRKTATPKPPPQPTQPPPTQPPPPPPTQPPPPPTPQPTPTSPPGP